MVALSVLTVVVLRILTRSTTSWHEWAFFSDRSFADPGATWFVPHAEDPIAMRSGSLTSYPSNRAADRWVSEIRPRPRQAFRGTAATRIAVDPRLTHWSRAPIGLRYLSTRAVAIHSPWQCLRSTIERAGDIDREVPGRRVGRFVNEIRLPRRDPVRDGYLLAAAAWCILIAFRVVPGASDGRGWWSLPLPDPYKVHDYSALWGWWFTPPIAFPFYPLTLLPVDIFAAVWTGIMFAALGLLVGRWSVLALLIPFVWWELADANITLLLGLAVVVGFRYPAAWSFVAYAATKSAGEKKKRLPGQSCSAQADRRDRLWKLGFRVFRWRWRCPRRGSDLIESLALEARLYRRAAAAGGIGNAEVLAMLGDAAAAVRPTTRRRRAPSAASNPRRGASPLLLTAECWSPGRAGATPTRRRLSAPRRASQ